MFDKKIFKSKEFAYVAAYIVASIIYYLIDKEILPIFVLLTPSVAILYLSERLKNKYFCKSNKIIVKIFNIATYLFIALVVFILSKLFMPNYNFNILYYLALMIFTDFLEDKIN